MTLPAGMKRLLVLLHGLGEHSLRYEKFHRHFQDHQIGVAIYDHPGHGRSEGREVYVDHFDELVDNFRCFHSHIRSQHQFESPLTLMGHSLGGLIALYAADRYGELVDQLVLSVPCLGVFVPKVLMGINQVLDYFMPQYVFNNPVYPAHLSHCPEEVQKYQKDELIKRKISVRLFREMVTYMALLERRESIALAMPVYLFLAGDDRIVDNRAIQRVYTKLDCPDKEQFVFDGFFHEIFNELGQQEAFSKLHEILNRRER